MKTYFHNITVCDMAVNNIVIANKYGNHARPTTLFREWRGSAGVLEERIKPFTNFVFILLEQSNGLQGNGSRHSVARFGFLRVDCPTHAD